MPKFSQTSNSRLQTCHPYIQKVFSEVVKKYDCSVLEGERTQERQEELYHTILPNGSRATQTLNSKHLRQSDGFSHAIDVAPYPIDWEDRERFYHFSGYVFGVADSMGIVLRWGGDWDSDKDLDDQTFYDLPHFEVVLDV